MKFTDCTAQDLSDRVIDKDNFSFLISKNITDRIDKDLPLRKKKLVTIGGVSSDLLTNLLGQLRINNEVNNFDVVMLLTAFQGGEIYFTNVNDTDCMVELSYK